MKKLLSVLLAVLLIIPVTANADMGAPGITSYTGEVIKEDGIDYYTYGESSLVKSGHYDKGTKLTANYELKHDGVAYLSVCEVENKDKCNYIKSADILPEGGKVSPDKGRKLDKASEYLVIADEVEVREGPSESYKVVGTLKKGDKGSYQYIMDANIYIEKGDVKGWVYAIEKRVFVKGADRIAVVEKDTDCGKIPANTVLTGLWDGLAWDGVSLVNYNGKECMVITFKSEELYEFRSEPYNSTTTKNGKLYETGELKKVIAEVPKGSAISYLASGEYWSERDYVEYNGTKGWYVEDEEEKPTPTPTTTPEPTSTPEPTHEPTTGDVAPTTDPEVISPNKSNEMDTMTIIIMCCIGAIAIALTALVTIILLNKKRKDLDKIDVESKIEETAEPVVVEEKLDETVIKEEGKPTIIIEEPIVIEEPEEKDNQE